MGVEPEQMLKEQRIPADRRIENAHMKQPFEGEEDQSHRQNGRR
jgi:hypothetical protein